MIVSHKHKFIFLRTCKTASSSLEIALSKHCGKDDIITPDQENDEKLRQDYGGRAPQHYEGDIPITNRRYWRRKLKGDRAPKYFHHIQARDVKAYIGDEIWNSYYKFAFERNPWDRAISLYYWRYKTEPRPSFYEFIRKKRLEKTVKRQGRNVYRINNKIAVDRICLYENMEEELKIVCAEIGLPELTLPHAKSTQRKNKGPYTELMNGIERDMITKTFKLEIDQFGYGFGDDSHIKSWSGK